MVFKHKIKIKRWKSFLFILLFSSIFCTSFAFKTNELQKIPTRDPVKLAKAMVDVICEFYIANDIKFDFIIYGKATNHIKDVINEITKKLTNEITVNIRHIEGIEIFIETWNWSLTFEQTAIIFTESKENIKYFHYKTDKYFSLGNIFPKQFKFLIYVEEMKNFDRVEDKAFFPINFS
ncbi:hypothetical protein PVAND_017016 [Polypedilum vanderplanki]|uniref:Uncharacterized protein n=1 Tax=Polypedilum vanderplanki TaxID=319348 RepID=A0A9J6BHH9_POLVA|nr:hypothetical protein PVAND_017016 [Polypedilum vanderplanki]